VCNLPDRLQALESYFDKLFYGEGLPSANIDLGLLIYDKKGKVGSGEPGSIAEP
jgi:hypothetical protein